MAADKTALQILTEILLDVKKDVAEVRKEVAEIKAMTYSNCVVLEEHQRRSTASEARHDTQEQKLEEFIVTMEPVREHVKTVSALTKAGMGFLKVVGVLASLTAAVLGIIKHLH